jgi:hypothetical protein
MRDRLLVLSVALAALGLAGCPELGCTDELVYGVEIAITEEGGATTEPIGIRYRVDGGEWSELASTEAPGSGDFSCTSRQRCSLGPEIAGEYEIEVTRGPSSASITARVSADRCHVRTVGVPVSLPAP